MSKQAFDKLMGQLPEEDKKAIYAAAAAYGLDFDSPEWIPFAITQHGLLAIQHAIEDLGAAVKEGSDHAIREAMKAIHDAKDAEVSTLQQAAAEVGAGLAKTAAAGRQSLEAQTVKLTAQLTEELTRSLQATAADIIARQVGPLNTAQQSLTAAVESARSRMAGVRHIGIGQVLGWASLGGFIAGALLVGVLSWRGMLDAPGQAQLTDQQTRVLAAGKDFLQLLPEFSPAERERITHMIDRNHQRQAQQ